jgi:hypothetical protein
MVARAGAQALKLGRRLVEAKPEDIDLDLDATCWTRPKRWLSAGNAATSPKPFANYPQPSPRGPEVPHERPELRNYRVSLVGYGVYAVWVTAESGRAACEAAERLWSETAPASTGATAASSTSKSSTSTRRRCGMSRPAFIEIDASPALAQPCRPAPGVAPGRPCGGSPADPFRVEGGLPPGGGTDRRRTLPGANPFRPDGRPVSAERNMRLAVPSGHPVLGIRSLSGA